MRTDPGPSIQRTFAVTIPVIVGIWFVAVPAVLSMSSFFALAGLMVAVACVGKIAYGNGQPVASVGPLLHGTERSGSLEHTRDRR
jgi:hypothetical protein